MSDGTAENTSTTAADPERSLTVTWSDPLAALQLALTMSREELLRTFTSPDFPKPPIAELLGFDVIEVEPGRVLLGFSAKEYHCNAMGVVAAGVTATVLDAAMWIAAQTSVEDRLLSTTSLSLYLVKQLPTSASDLRAEARAVHIGRSTGTAEGRLLDADGKLYAHATSGLIAVGG